MPNSKETLLWHAKQLGILDQIAFHEMLKTKKNYYITISKYSKNISNPKQLLKQLDNCVLTPKGNGTYQNISRQYGLE